MQKIICHIPGMCTYSIHNNDRWRFTHSDYTVAVLLGHSQK